MEGDIILYPLYVLSIYFSTSAQHSTFILQGKGGSGERESVCVCRRIESRKKYISM